MAKVPQTQNPVFKYDPKYEKFSSKYFYVYYIPGHDNSDSDMRCYFVKRRDRTSWDHVEKEVRTILDDIDEGEIKSNDSDPRWQEWKHRSYFVVVLEGVDQWGSSTPITVSGAHAGPFRNGELISLDDMNLSGFVCLNHLTNANGNVLKGGDDEQFKITINHQKTHEISGTNMGPPIGGG